MPDRSRTLVQGVIKPWQTGLGAECQADLLRVCRRFGVPLNVPFHKLSQKWQDFVLEGEPGYGKDSAHEWPHAWYGLKGYFRWLESRAYKMHVRVLLSRYRVYTPCPDCQGKRFQPEALLYRVPLKVQNPKSKVQSQTQGAGSQEPGVRTQMSKPGDQRQEGLALADFYQLPIRDALGFIEAVGKEHRLTEEATGCTTTAGRLSSPSPLPKGRGSGRGVPLCSPSCGPLSKPNDPLGLVLNEVRSRLGYLHEVGLGYLTLNRPTRSLSGGETERVNLTTCLGTRLVNTIFVLDEPSVGLHPRDTERLVRILQQLRDAGNTVVVVEHEASVMRAANQIVDLGPGHGATGGQVVFQGSCAEILKAEASLTGQYLSGRKQIEIPSRRPVQQNRERLQPYTPHKSHRSPTSHSNALMLQEAAMPFGQSWGAGPALTLAHATKHNLKDLTVAIPLGRFVCVTGVSGSGKTTLVREVLLPALAPKLKSGLPETKASNRLAADQNGQPEEGESALDTPRSAFVEGAEALGRVIQVDQAILGKTPRSNPAVYIGAFDDIREFFAQSEVAQQRGLNASAFSFNSSQGQCERCRGAGFERIEMQFLSDVFIRCPDCNGRRYRAHILDVKISPQSTAENPKSAARTARTTHHAPRTTDSRLTHLPRRSGAAADHASRAFSIADLLEATIEEASEFLAAFPGSRPAQRAVEGLGLLQEVGLGYLKLGQPINTLSGGESQRLKLVRHLAEATTTANASQSDAKSEARSPKSEVEASCLRPTATLFLFDEPTTGLHFDNVRVLLKVFQRLVDAGHSVLVIEHNLDVIKCADWIIDLGPEAGDQGGRIVAQGTPEDIARCPNSYTGQALKEVLLFSAEGQNPKSEVRSPKEGRNPKSELRNAKS